MMAMSDLQRQVATAALAAARKYGFALAGGGALAEHGITSRFTADIDLHTDRLGVMHKAAAAVEAALKGAGLKFERQEPEWGRDSAEWVTEWWVTDPSTPADQMLLKLAIYGRQGRTKTMTVGPVLAVKDVIAGKICALVERADERDFVDVAAFLGQYSASELIAMAKAAHPTLEDAEFARAGQQLDRLPDEAFTRYGSDLTPAEMRARFSGWPR
jgi:hypothetical protein